MQEDIKKLVKSVTVYTRAEVTHICDVTKWVPENDFNRVVDRLTRWNNVEDMNPKFGKAVNVRFLSVKDEILECTAKLEEIPRYTGKDAPIDRRWFVYPSSGHELTGRVVKWKYII